MVRRQRSTVDIKAFISGVKGEYSLHGATSLPHYKEWAMKTPLLKYYSVHSKSTAVLVERVYGDTRAYSFWNTSPVGIRSK